MLRKEVLLFILSHFLAQGAVKAREVVIDVIFFLLLSYLDEKAE